jgi:hypothetical protein
VEDGPAQLLRRGHRGALAAEPPACGCGGADRRRAATGGLPHRRSRQKPPRSRRVPLPPPAMALAVLRARPTRSPRDIAVPHGRSGRRPDGWRAEGVPLKA